jgi:hypothetical protein
MNYFKKIIISLLKKFKIRIVRESHDIIHSNLWSYFTADNKRLNLYYEGIKAANGEKTDNLLKKLRHFAECGVWKGHSAYLIASIIQNEFNDSFHIFDSFEGGLSDKVDKDLVEGQSDNEIKEEKLIFSSNLQDVKRTLNNFQFIKYHPGWIPETFHEVSEINFSFVHIDVDLYQPTKDSLEFFYERLNNGGVIICDDYGLNQFPGAKSAVDEFISNNKYSFFYEVPYGSCIIIK